MELCLFSTSFPAIEGVENSCAIVEFQVLIYSTPSAMAESEDPSSHEITSEEPEETPGYKPPAQKTLKEIQDQDQEDESLVRYKQMLLAGAESGTGKSLAIMLFLLCLYFHGNLNDKVGPSYGAIFPPS